MKYQFISTRRDALPVEKMCRVLGVNRSGYYVWKNGEPSKREKDRIRLKHEIRRIFELHKGRYGSPRITMG